MPQSKTRTMVLTAFFAAFTAVLAQIIVPIGPIPFNLAVLGVYLAGMLLSPAAAFGSVAVYIVLGAFGVPVFAGFMGGPAVLFGKTGGYIMGYLFIALFTSLAKSKSGKTFILISAMAFGLMCCYAFGTLWFMIITGLSLGKSLVFCVYPFIVPDVLKAALALVLFKLLGKRLGFINKR